MRRAHSDFADVVMRDTAFGAWKLRLESEVSHEVRRVVHVLTPNWLDLFGRPGFRLQRELVIYRSRTNGTWQPSPWNLGEGIVSDRDLRAPPLMPVEVAASQHLEHLLERRGSRLLLTYVPTPRPLGGGPALLADVLGVPLVAPSLSGLRTEDGDHLDEPSGVVWSEALVRELGLVIR
jgi:hypothetical protein